jgi:hypothetical protein
MDKLTIIAQQPTDESFVIIDRGENQLRPATNVRWVFQRRADGAWQWIANILPTLTDQGWCVLKDVSDSSGTMVFRFGTE